MPAIGRKLPSAFHCEQVGFESFAIACLCWRMLFSGGTISQPGVESKQLGVSGRLAEEYGLPAAA